MTAARRSAKESAGLLLFRRRLGGVLEVLLAHPGGPFWAGKDAGAWSIPKGELEAGEERLAAARREVAEEIGFSTSGPYIPLGSVRQKSGKVVHAWAVEHDEDPSAIRSNTCEVEWPPRSGKRITIPEVDHAAYFAADGARTRMNPAQVELLDRLLEYLASAPSQ